MVSITSCALNFVWRRLLDLQDREIEKKGREWEIDRFPTPSQLRSFADWKISLLCNPQVQQPSLSFILHVIIIIHSLSLSLSYPLSLSFHDVNLAGNEGWEIVGVIFSPSTKYLAWEGDWMRRLDAHGGMISAMLLGREGAITWDREREGGREK